MADPGASKSIKRIVDTLLALDADPLLEILTNRGSEARQSWIGIDNLLVPALERIGEDWESGELALSQLYLAGRMCERLVNDLFPLSQAESFRVSPRLGLAVLEDYHLLGKRIIYSILRSAGFLVRDYGRVDVEELVQRVLEDRIEIILISTLMLNSALRVKDFCRALKSSSPETKVMVGGAPFRFDESLWREVGADAMGTTATDALGFILGTMGSCP